MHPLVVVAALSGLLALLFVPAFLLFFAGFWCVICLLLGQFSGWGRLARQFRAKSRPDGEVFHFASAVMNATRYNNCLTFCIAREGLYLAPLFMFRPGHPPLLIPWSALGPITPQKNLWMRLYGLPILLGSGETVNLALWGSRLAQEIEARRPATANRVVAPV